MKIFCNDLKVKKLLFNQTIRNKQLIKIMYQGLLEYPVIIAAKIVI